MAVGGDGVAYSWGDCDGGALGHDTPACNTPTAISTASGGAREGAQVSSAHVRNASVRYVVGTDLLSHSRFPRLPASLRDFTHFPTALPTALSTAH